jgi:hypothetical protein
MQSDTQAAIADQLTPQDAPPAPDQGGGDDPKAQVMDMIVQALDAGIITPDDIVQLLQGGAPQPAPQPGM